MLCCVVCEGLEVDGFVLFGQVVDVEYVFDEVDVVDFDLFFVIDGEFVVGK